MKKTNSLKGKLILIISLITIIPLVLNSLLEVNSFRKSILLQTEEEQKNTVSMKSENINEWLSNKINTLEAIYKNHPEFLKNDKDITMKSLDKIKNMYHDIKAFSYIDKEGNLWDTNGANVNISEQEHFKEASKGKSIVVSDVFVDKIDGGKIVVFDKPVLNESGEFSGIVQVVANASYLDKLITEIKIEDTGYGYLMNESGLCLIHKEKDYIGKNIKSINNTAFNIIKTSKEENKSNFVSYKSDINNIEYLSAYNKIKDTNWILVTLAPKKEAMKGLNRSISISISIIITSIIIVVLISFMLIRAISKLLDNTSEIIIKTSEFNLKDETKFDKYLSREDEIGYIFKALANMRKSLRNIVYSIKDNSVKINNNTDGLSKVMNETSKSLEEISKASENLAFSSTDLAKSVEQGVNKLDDLALEINDVNSLSEKVKEYMIHTEDKNNDGIKHIKVLEDSVKSNNESANRLFMQIEDLSKKSNNINMITDTIKGITEQINLLSLNAAIEAARAGDNGKGFAVVAEEIRKLANETNISTKKIENMVRDMEDAVFIIRKEINTTNAFMDNMNKATFDTKVIFNIISETVLSITEQINILIGKINNIDDNKNHVLEYMENMSAISEESASTTEEVSASVQQQTSNMGYVVNNTNQLKEVTIELKELISKFEI